jgi:uncharacterized protein
MMARTIPPAIPVGAERILSRVRHWALIRILSQIMAVVITVAVSSRLLGLLIPLDPSPLHSPLAIIRNLFVAGAALTVYALVVRWTERRTAVELDLYKGRLQLPIGAAIGIALMACVYLIFWVADLVNVTPGTEAQVLGVGLVTMFLGAVFEELLFRAILFRIVEEACGTTIALAVSAILFGLVHGLNPGATLFSDAAIAVEAGLALALAYALTRNLWLPIGIHMGWNFAEGSLFGAQVSGQVATPSLIHATLSGPVLLTGGGFGPEASIISVGVCCLEAAVLVFMIVRVDGWRPHGFRPTLP